MKNIFIVIILFACVNLIAQTDSTNVSELNHNLGIAAGFTVGLGPSYRYMPNKDGIQVTFVPLVESEETRLWTGLTYLHQVSRDFKHQSSFSSNIFYYLSAFHRYEKLIVSAYSNNSGYYATYSYDNFFNVGTGLGYEIEALKHLSINIMIGYAGVRNFEILSPTIESGIYFKL